MYDKDRMSHLNKQKYVINSNQMSRTGLMTLFNTNRKYTPVFLLLQNMVASDAGKHNSKQD